MSDRALLADAALLASANRMLMERLENAERERDDARRALATEQQARAEAEATAKEDGERWVVLLDAHQERAEKAARERAAAEAEVVVLRKAVGDGFQGAYRDGWADGQENMPHPCEACSRDECDGCTDPAFVRGRAHQATTPEPVEG